MVISGSIVTAIILRGEDAVVVQNTNRVSPESSFTSGVYYRLPNTNNPNGILSSLDRELGFTATMLPVDFDISLDMAVYANDSALYFVSSEGNVTKITVNGLYAMARPSLSPDGTMVAVQATDQRPSGGSPDPQSLEIFIVDTDSGSVIAQVSPSEDGLPAESPTWFHRSSRLAYSTFSADSGVDIHIVDVTDTSMMRETLTIQDAGWLHIAIAPDDSVLLVPVTMRIYDLTDGSLIADLKDETLAGLADSPYTRDTRFTGDLDNFPLDGSFSPDGQSIVFDGAVTQGDSTGMIISTIDRDGTNFHILSDFIPTNPTFSNNNNYSQLNPVWL